MTGPRLDPSFFEAMFGLQPQQPASPPPQPSPTDRLFQTIAGINAMIRQALVPSGLEQLERASKKYGEDYGKSLAANKVDLKKALSAAPENQAEREKFIRNLAAIGSISPLEGYLEGSAIKEPVYHGSNKRFTVFEPRPSKRNVDGSVVDVRSPVSFFATDKETAKSFARDRAQISVKLKGEKAGRPEVRPFHISVKQPLDFTITPEVRERMTAEGYSPYYNPSAPSPYALQEVERLTGYTPETWEDIHALLDDVNVVEAMKSDGYDGVRLKESNGGEAWGIFHPTQAKHATRNRGTFDPTNPSILASLLALTGLSHLQDNK